MAKKTFHTYAAKMRQANKEALITVIALLVIIAVWLLGGLGLADSDIVVFSTPIWIIGGTVGTWVVTFLIAVILGKLVFKNFSLDDEDEGATRG